MSNPNDLLLETLSDTGKTPETRIKDSKSARDIYKKLRQADEVSARNRAEIDALFAGEPPYDDAELRATGQGARANVNFGEAEGLLENAMAGYVDLLSSVETLINFKSRYKGDPNNLVEYEQTVAEEFTTMLRAWADYTPNWLRNSTTFLSHGVGICYFENDLDWRWRVGGLSDFLVPRRTLAGEGNIEVACCTRAMQAHQLYRFIADEERAAEVGWDVAAVKNAIINAVSHSTSTYSATSWETVVRDLKNNDLYIGVATASEIKVVHVWNVEFDGKVTHSIILEDEPSKEKDKFLYRKVGKFSSMVQAFVIFTYGVGVNGYLHSIRGLGAKIFSEVQVSNRLRNQMVDGAMLSSSVMLQPQNEEALQNLQLTYFGAYSIMTPGIEVVERTIPNVSTSVLPVLNDMASLINGRTGGYAASTPSSTAKERTKYEVRSEQSDRARLSSSNLGLFYDPLDRLFREVVRRVCRKDYHPADPGGQEVAQFRRRCFERGVPLEVLYQVDLPRVTAARAIGAGSEEVRQLTFDEFSQIAPAFDEAGRQNFIRDRVAARIGYHNADRYVPKPTSEARPLMDQKFAGLENASLLNSEPLPIYPNDNHRLHSQVHIAALSQGIQGIESGEADIMQVVPGLVTLLEHATAHVEAMGNDTMLAEEAAQNRKILSQINGTLVNAQRHVDKVRRQQEAQSGQQPQPGQPDPQEQQMRDFDVKLQSRLAEHAAKLQMLKEMGNLKLQLHLQEGQQKLALKDAETAQKLAAGRV